MTKRFYPAGATEAQKRDIDNLSELSAYAYGFSDEKPGPAFWIIILCMVGFIAWTVIHGGH